jgi:hypothetical protein
MRKQLTKIVLSAALVLAITFIFSCSNSDDGGGGGLSSGSGVSKADCIREGLEISANTLNDIVRECEATKKEVLS